MSILLGAGLGGILGAFLAIPVAASAEIILERPQARDVPVGLEPSPGAAEDDEPGADSDTPRAGDPAHAPGT